MLMISPSNTSPVLTDPTSRSPFYFRTAYNDRYKLEELAEFLVGEGLSTAGTLAVDSISLYAEEFSDRFAALGGTVTHQLTVADDQADFSTELAALASSPPDVLFFLSFENAAELVTQARDTAGLEGTLLASTDDFVGQFLLDNLDDPADAEGIVFSARDLSFLEEEPYLSRLLAEYEPRFGAPESEVPGGHASAFDATNRLLDVIQTFQRRGSRQLVIPRTALRDAFAATTDYPGVTGSITCDPNGDCNPQEFVIRVVEDGEFVQISP